MVGILGWAIRASAQDDIIGEPVSPRVDGSFGEGVTLGTADDSVSMTVTARLQVRGTLTAPSDPDAFADEATSGFALRRARLAFTGHALTRDLTYYVQLGFSNQDTEPDLRLPLRDAVIGWQVHRDLEIRAGQTKVPYGRQRVTSSGSQELVDRSIATGEFNLDRDVGVFFRSSDLGGLGGRVGYTVALLGGDGRNRVGDNFGFLGVTRLVVRPFGAFDDSAEADLLRSREPRLAIAGGYAHNRATNRPRSTFDLPYEGATFDYAHLGADLMFKWRGACLQAEWFRRAADRDVAITPDPDGGPPLIERSRSGVGGYLQLGQMVTRDVELVARYGEIRPFAGTDPDLVRARELGGGPSVYFRAHALKLQADWFYLPTGDDLAGGGHQVRAQLQVWL